MKFMKSIAFLVSMCLIMTACKKHVIEPLPITEPASNLSKIKVVYASAYTVNYSVQIKINDVRVSNSITYSTPFPGGGQNTGGGNYPDYISTNPGALKIGISLPANGSNSDSLTLSSNTVSVESSRYYSIYLADTAANTQAILVEENKTPVSGDFSRYKFVNTMPNLPALDLYFDTTLVAANVAYKGQSGDFNLVRGATGQWEIRTAGADPASTPLAVYPSTGKQTVPNARILSIYARGFSGVTGTRAPAISLLYN